MSETQTTAETPKPPRKAPLRKHVAVAIVRRPGEVLLVQQHWRGLDEACWALPGGQVEAGELLREALRRELREETGLELVEVGPIAFVCQVEYGNVSGSQTATPSYDESAVFAVEVNEWSGSLAPTDPDEEILDVQFFSIPEALLLLAKVPLRHVREPAVAYLKSNLATRLAPGEKLRSLWAYRVNAEGVSELVDP